MTARVQELEMRLVSGFDHGKKACSFHLPFRTDEDQLNDKHTQDFKIIFQKIREFKWQGL